jgi:hypothetical protein
MLRRKKMEGELDELKGNLGMVHAEKDAIYA